MNLKIKKNALVASACMAFLLGGAPQVWAADFDSVTAAQQQTKKITGTILDQAGIPVIGANVLEKGTSNGTITNLDGKFTLNVKPGATLHISYIGYKVEEITVGSAQNYQITLKEDTERLDEVVVVGYGIQKKKLVTGATVEVKGEDIAKLNTTQALGALQSQTPGVNIQANSGQPGDGFKISIRGAGTNGNTAPLYIIDGVAGDINNLNPADIERIDVLKDAASCAIYGSAAANGVILVTTKQGKEGKLQISYDANIGISNVYRLPQMLTAKQYMEVQDVMQFNTGAPLWNWSDYLDEDLLAAYQSGANPGTNWVEAIRNKDAITTSHALNLTGGTDRSKISLGAGYQYQDGVFGNVVKSDYRRFTFRINSEHILYRNSKGMDVVKVGETMYYSHKQSQGIQIGNQYSNALSTMLRANPLVPMYNADGEYFGWEDIKNSGTKGLQNYNQYTVNPILVLVNSQNAANKSVSHGFNLSGYLEIQPIKNLIYRGQVNYNQSTWSWRSFLPVFTANALTADGFRSESQATNQLGTGWGWSTTNTLNYRFDIEDHNFDILLGTEYGESRPDYGFSLSATASNAIFDDLRHAYMDYMKNNASATVGGSPYGDSRSFSYFGRLNYNWKETYMLSAIMRADGNSKFAPGQRWGYFPSVSAGWVISNEAFMEDLQGKIDFLKLRAGWGQNGNAGSVGNFQWQGTFQFGPYGNYSFNSNKDGYTSGAYPSRLENLDLTWETSEQMNIGLDARFFNSRLNFTFDYYQKKTKDLLVQVPIDASTGFSTMWSNAGTVKNEGFEVALAWHDQIGKDFNYNIGWNMAYNKNKVTEVNSSQKYNNGGNDLLSQGTGVIARFEEGHPIGYFWGYKTDGVIQNEQDLAAYKSTLLNGDPANSRQGSSLQVGDLKFVDVNGDGILNDNDKTNLGNPHPDVTMGINLGASYKGFDFNVTGFAALGQEVLVLIVSSLTVHKKTLLLKYTITGTVKAHPTSILVLHV